MKNLLLFLLLISNLLSAELIKALSYEEAIELATEQKKRVMVLITQDDCRYCIRMKKTTFSDDEVIKRINKNYIYVEVNRYKDEYPKKVLTVFGVPTTYFLYSDGSPIMKGAGGYWNKENFFSFMDDADYKTKKKLKGK